MVKRIDSGEGYALAWADTQQRGRGRRDRTWDSPGGGLYASIVIDRIPELADSLVLLGLVQSWRSFLEFAFPDLELRVKWPNDLLLAGKKLGGFLAENDNGRLYLGMGLNIVREPDGLDSFRVPPTALANHTRSTPPISELLHRWFEQFMVWLDQPDQKFNPRNLEQSLVPLGTRVTWGDETGKAVSLGSRGQLIVDVSGESVELDVTDGEELQLDEISG